jgi:anti-anti-sigma regulatory factor
MNSPTEPNGPAIDIQNIANHLVVKFNPAALGADDVKFITVQLSGAIQNLANAGAGRYVVLDFTGVPLLSSIGLGMCVDIYHCAQKYGRKCATYGLQSRTLELFHLMHLDRMYENLSTQTQLQERLV